MTQQHFAQVLSITRTSFTHPTIQLQNVLFRCHIVTHVPVKVFAYLANQGTFWKTISVSNVFKQSITVFDAQTDTNVKFVLQISHLTILLETALVKLVGMCQVHAQRFMVVSVHRNSNLHSRHV